MSGRLGMDAAATLVVVCYRTHHVDLDWVPARVPVVIVHNDDALDPASVRRDNVVHVQSAGNVGFGTAVNAALGHVATPRVVLCNPDTSLSADHWRVLCDGGVDDVVVVPLSDGEGRPTSVVNRYPTPLTLLLSAYRVGRFAPRGGALRRGLATLAGHWGREHVATMGAVTGEWSLHDHWASAAVVSLDADRLRAVGGFDERYFLYFEDVDLCRRLAQRHPAIRVRLAPTAPGIHAVGGSAGTGTARHRFASAVRYCSSHHGLRWRLCRLALSPRAALGSVRAGAG